MTTTTPPGWYPEPGHTGNGPAMERWWDGSTWTEYTRTAPVPVDAVQQPYAGYPGTPGYPGDVVAGGPGGGGRRTGAVVIAIVAALVLIGGVVAGILVLGKDDKSDKTASPTPSASAPHRGDSQAPRSPDGQSPDPNAPDGSQGPDGGSDGKAVDGYDGIRLPVLDGWTGTSGANGIGASVVTGGYPCPGDASKDCVRGGVFAQPAEALKLTATSAESAAKADIAQNAADAYSTDIYGATTSHQQIASQPVTVAGKKGYFVRWKIVTKSGTSGYVESLAFPSPRDPKNIAVVRFGFDIGSNAPGLAVMDQITQGIKADSSGGTGSTGGTGV
ncbi:DUF2510 domain-containing protein [Streptomyces sp. CBMA29]|uniref:DUF2510 domain-containing protein n=1 Tax=Streptomyces sp. CBMA29 TaxID=1896314 RepID=UPI001661D9DF|nr:DUF2510 domain-containing protein [Streptomyces sp. CBMA29]MBD0737976.1 hypothetical protein [Streptomyces sp. CBMA29]